VTPALGQSKNYGTDDPPLSYTVTGAAAGETAAFTGALGRAPGEAAGEYEILLGSLTLADNGAFLASNYVLTFTPGVLFEILSIEDSAESGLFTVDTRDPYTN
jgi:hypothetical protein